MELLFDRKGGASANLSDATGISMQRDCTLRILLQQNTAFIKPVQLDGRVFVAMLQYAGLAQILCVLLPLLQLVLVSEDYLVFTGV